jgi:hypothetical protein
MGDVIIFGSADGLKKVTASLTRIEHLLEQLVQLEETEVTQMDDLNTEVAQNTDAVQSAITLMNSLSQQLKDAVASNDPAAVQAVIDQLDANTNELAASVAANTPAAPVPPPEPAPPPQ